MSRLASLVSRFFLASFLLASLALAQGAGQAGGQQPSEQRGFNADTAYQLGDVDHINLFNGALTLTVPLGPSYPVGPNFAFQLTLVYTSNGWDHEDATCNFNGMTQHYQVPIPEPNANAGFGWRVLPGRLGEPFLEGISYFPPDGGEIFFNEELHPGFPAENAQPNTWFSTDGTYLRLRFETGDECVGAGACYLLEKPNGVIHQFNNFAASGGHDWRLTRVSDRFAANHFIAYDYSMANKWVITDSRGRSHTVNFDASGTVTSVALEAFESATANTFTLGHTMRTIDRLNYFPTCDAGTAIPSQIQVPMLDSITQPDGTVYKMVYDTQSSSTVFSGVVRSLRLPTGGEHEYDWQQITFVEDVPDLMGPENARTSFGVTEKRMYAAFGDSASLIGKWQYDYADLSELPTADAFPDRGRGSPCYYKTTVTDPVGNTTRHYFDGVNADRWQYALPYRRCDEEGVKQSPPYLSQEVFTASGFKLRSVLVEYETDGDFGGYFQAKNHRLSKRRAVHHDDSNKFIETTYTDFDGLGHYRKVTTRGNFFTTEELDSDDPGYRAIQAAEKVVTTKWNAGRGSLNWVTDDTVPGGGTLSGGFIIPGRETAWVLNTYTERTVQGDGDTAKSEYCFDRATGFMLRSRMLVGASRSAQDVLKDFEEQLIEGVKTGYLAIERTYGGDPGGLDTGELCDITLTTSDAATQLVHSYAHGVLSRSRYLECGSNATILELFNNTIDQRTGLLRTRRDSAGVATSYSYDAMWRVTQERRAEGAWTNTTYALPDGTSTSAPEIKIRQYGNDDVGGTLLSKQDYLFDGLGRLRQEKISYPGAAGTAVDALRNFTYDGLSRRITESMWGDSNALQRTTYDALGRVIEIQPADATLAPVLIRYAGARHVSRTVSVASGEDGEENFVCTREEYDSLGRLVIVRENRGSDSAGACNGGSGLITAYNYDEADRLTRVCAGGGDCVQQRHFNYDNRGFLNSESHPELGASGNGTAQYSYDANGNALSKAIVGSGDFSLRYRYDGASRLVAVDQLLDASSEDTRPLKSFHYARSNSGDDKRAGKLVQARRTNWVDIVDPLSNVPGTLPVTVTQVYAYEGLDGQVSSRQTRYNLGAFHYAFDTDFSFDQQGNLSSITYPQCLHAECPPGSMPPRTVSYDYTRGYLSAVPSYASAVSYQLGGMVKSVTHANGVTENITPAPANLSRPGSIATSGVADGNSWSTGTYVYDGAGNIKSIGEQTFRYDGLNRLVHGEVNLGGDDPLVQSASYDNYGNLTALSTAGMNLATAVGTNRLVAGTYDAAGNLTDIVQNGVDFDYRYDALNMMTSLQSTNDQARIFIYDADDERLVTFDCVGTTQCSQDSRTTFTVRDLDGRVLRVFEDLPGEPWTWERDYVYRGSQLLASVEPDTSGGERTLHLHLDHLGTPRQVTGPGAIEVSRHHYFPFGDEATDPLQDEVALKFTGHERDENGGAGVLDYMHARYCSPVLGRFASIDPILSADPAKPQSWNKYSYAASNPLRFIDPTGLYICEGAETDCLFVADAVNAIEDAIIGLSDASEAEMLALQQALEFFGNPGEENGVVIVISEVEGGSMSARYNRRKRLNRINVTLDLYDVQVEGSAAHRAELAAGLVHEADHGLQQRQLGRMWGDLETVIGAEITATSRQAIVYRGLKHPSSTGMWSPKNGYDFNAILKWSESSVASFCRTSKACSR